MKIGVPFDVAHCMNWPEAIAYQVVAGELDGGTFDWSRMEFERDDG